MQRNDISPSGAVRRFLSCTARERTVPGGILFMTRLTLSDLPSLRFCRLTIVSLIREQGVTFAMCSCDCGVTKRFNLNNVRNGNSKSCGCLMRELLSVSKHRHGHATNGITQEYRAWTNMWDRCTRTTSDDYPNYGGRGITVCARWKDFTNFLADMGLKPSPKLQLDRQNNNGNYEPGNCRWATLSQQAKNRRPFKRKRRHFPTK